MRHLKYFRVKQVSTTGTPGMTKCHPWSSSGTIGTYTKPPWGATIRNLKWHWGTPVSSSEILGTTQSAIWEWLWKCKMMWSHYSEQEWETLGNMKPLQWKEAGHMWQLRTTTVSNRGSFWRSKASSEMDSRAPGMKLNHSTDQWLNT